MRKTLIGFFVGLGIASAVAGGITYPPILGTTCSTSQWIRIIAAGTGAATCSQPAYTDLSGSLPAGQRLQSKTITITRNLTTGSGAVSYTGVGFQPTVCIANGAVAATLTQYLNVFSIADSSLTSVNVPLAGGALSVNTSNFLVFGDATNANFNNAVLTSYDSDGFTLTWTKVASPTGTATIYVTCFR